MRAAISFLASITLAAQVPTDEVRVSSRPYVPFHLRVETNLVELSVVVRDRAGNPVSGLKQTDFQLFEEGKPRDIASFSMESRSVATAPSVSVAPGPPPTAAAAARPGSSRYVALFFDDFGTASGELAFTKNAAKKFVEDALQPTDHAAIFTTSGGRASNFTTDHAQLAAAIDNVQTHARFSQQDTAACPRITPYDAYRITILMDEDAIHAATSEMSICGLGLPTAPATPRVPGRVNRADPSRNLVITQAEQIWQQVRATSQNTMAAISTALANLSVAKPPSTRMLLLVSSGFLTGTLERERDLIIDQALRSDIIVNSLDAKGLFTESPGRPLGEDQGVDAPPEVYLQETMNAVDRQESPSSILANLAFSTGGMFFHHNNNFSRGLRTLAALPETSYTIGFHPDDAALDNKYHKLKIRLTSGGLNTIQARPGYLAAPRTRAAEEAGRTALEQEVTSTTISKDIPAAAEAQLNPKTPSGTTAVRVKMHVDLKEVEFPLQDGRHMQKLTFVFALLDKENSIVAAREGTMEFAVGDAKFQSLLDNGVNAVLTLEAPPGTYRLRTVAIEGVHSKIASLSNIVTLP